MADSSWDNGGYGKPAKAGLPLWGKIALGCGVAFLIALVTCVGGAAYLTHKANTDPGWFKKKAMSAVGLGLEKIRPDWEDFRTVVEQLRTPDGCRALYAANPGLARTWPTEAAFLDAASRWHQGIRSAPDLSTEVMEQGLHVVYGSGGQLDIGWSPKEGRAVYASFAARPKGGAGPRRLTGLEVR